MKKLFVTLADEGYADPARQLFAGAWFQGGWDGEFMLLAQDLSPATRGWFADRGILIRDLPPLRSVGRLRYGEILRAKLTIFTPEFDEWDNIVYLDSDIIIRGSLAPLGRIRGFAAVTDMYDHFAGNVIDADDATPEQRALIEELARRHDLRRPSFNAGVLAFSPRALKPDDARRLFDLSYRYDVISTCPGADQLALNLVFKDRWQHLPRTYNIQPRAALPLKVHHPVRLGARVLHFAGPMHINPWEPRSPFNEEWLANLERAEEIGRNHRSGSVDQSTLGPLIESLALRLRVLVFYERRRRIRAFRRQLSQALTAAARKARSRFPVAYSGLRELKHRILATEKSH